MLNQSIFIGRLTKEPELQVVGEKQTSKTRFTLAVNRPKYGDAEPPADFIPVAAWGKTAEFVCRNFHKGKQVYAVGRLQTYSWEGDDGVKRYGFEVVANEVGFADAPQKNGQAKSKANTAPQNGGFPDGDIFGGADDFGGDFPGFNDLDGSEDDLPF
ncbi:MAG: single-stranded DNA-binding protein [Clostridia bacterium]|nr:single-stranded DNA-binding protein [Clostridia bacterium]MCI8979416.1 single-stranded DNA-binding protein [Clostridia bacterium]MCI9086700.1 single-stranded DNA-binding protein [Clostridia bacterium]NDO20302.1 single-stranded DNA-binding protein [Lachnospiraceae bacterium MD329]